ncbi:MAG: thiol:disulfide interchange protein DsbG [Pseudomonas sp.]|uniref:thiol:disulfide interchange protein DsbG n=1 Tax=Ectopseudomonas guguanensis TaxID=1198456 RepID=UPI000CBD70C5|nr:MULTISPECIES: thiol:disulfide interchange protein DsbG [Pseudomonas]MBQ1557754.1 thiol:disulfide interchange protein DsbG [Pseudomonas sp.]MPT16557.1 thiol:disulfide interchange protein DsbG [Pseudomonas sp.]PKM04253.1 MAG: thiol:disulfide interchange protein DsbG [Gammaproteobacteria bacterium HGW-Gammaproteobacteria-6]WJH56666.1 thiol:disulfide interchange protein DsbG [Pseudomonas guguanensis]
MNSIKSLALLGLLLTPLAQADELPAAIKAVEGRGAKVVGSFDAPGGLKGYAARYNGQGLALYLTADGEHVLIGTLLDAKGEDLTKEPLERLVYQPLGQEMWQQLQDSTWIADGDDKAPRVVYMFSDPNCPYCNMFWRQARPWVEAGRVQVRHVMVGMLRPDSPGKAAALLAASDQRKALGEHESAGRESTLKPLGKIPEKITEQLNANMELMGEMGASATPAIYYLDDAGRLQQQNGAPRPDMLETIMGSAKP